MNSCNSELKKFSHNVGQNWYHVVLTPRARYPVFQHKDTKDIAEAAFEWICERHKIDLFSKEVMPDHVHLFVSCPPKFSISKLFQVLKGGSSWYIRNKQQKLKRYNHLWSRGAMYRSVGNVSAETIKKYIEESNKWSATKQKKLF